MEESAGIMTGTQRDHAPNTHATTRCTRALAAFTSLLVIVFLLSTLQSCFMLEHAASGEAVVSWMENVQLPPALVVTGAASAPVVLLIGVPSTPEAVHRRVRHMCALNTIACFLAMGRNLYFFEQHDGIDHRLVCADALIILAFGFMCFAFTLGTLHLYCYKPRSPWPTLRMGACVSGVVFLTVNTVIRFWLMPPPRADGSAFIYVPGSKDSSYASAMVSMVWIALIGVAATDRNRRWLKKRLSGSTHGRPLFREVQRCNVPQSKSANPCTTSRDRLRARDEKS